MVEKELNLHNKKLSKIDHLQDDLVSVVLSSNRLTSLPPVIGNLSVLKKLDISHNLLSSLPEEFGKLKNLEVLCMVSNRSLGTNDSTWLDGKSLSSLKTSWRKMCQMRFFKPFCIRLLFDKNWRWRTYFGLNVLNFVFKTYGKTDCD